MKAQNIVTFNLKDSPCTSLENYEIQAVHPDEFIEALIDLAPETILESLKRQQSFLKKPKVPMKELLRILEKNSLRRSVVLLKDLL